MKNIMYGLSGCDYMKKNLICVLIITIFILSSCGGRYEIKNSRHSDEISEIIISCFDDKDVDKMKDIFCSYVQDMDNLEDEIEDAFDEVEGKVISYNSVYYGSDGSIRDGKWKIKRDQTEIREIETDKGEEFIIKFSEYIIYDEDKDKEGVYFIQLRDKDYNVLCTIGDFME